MGLATTEVALKSRDLHHFLTVTRIFELVNYYTSASRNSRLNLQGTFRGKPICPFPVFSTMTLLRKWLKYCTLLAYPTFFGATIC